MSDKNTHAADAAGTTVPGLRVETIDVVDELADVADFVAMLGLVLRGMRGVAPCEGIDENALRCAARLTDDMEGRLRGCVDRLTSLREPTEGAWHGTSRENGGSVGDTTLA
jgi:hypothetical protein